LTFSAPTRTSRWFTTVGLPTRVIKRTTSQGFAIHYETDHLMGQPAGVSKIVAHTGTYTEDEGMADAEFKRRQVVLDDG
jgi:hypothetical protein